MSSENVDLVLSKESTPTKDVGTAVNMTMISLSLKANQFWSQDGVGVRRDQWN